MAYCTNCGDSVLDVTNFCTNCGTSLKPAQSWETSGHTLYDAEASTGMNPDESPASSNEELIVYVAQRLASGADVNAVTGELVEAGTAREDALHFVDVIYESLVDQATRAANAEEYKRHMLYGLLWMGGGAGVSLIAYLAASGGGVYFLFWGAVIWGAIDFVRGLTGWLSNK